MPAVASAQVACIQVQTPDGRTQSYEVSPDDGLIVGSSQSCSVRLECMDVASMHCLIRLEHGRLSVQDWYTALGTFLNGERIQQPCTFGPGDEIRIGDYRVTAQFADVAAEPESPSPRRSDARSNANSQRSTLNSPPSTDDFSSVADWARDSGLEAANAAFNDLFQAPEDRDQNPKPAAGELRQLKLRITELELENDELRLQAQAWKDSAGDGAVDPFDLDLVDLLKSEIQQLQHEVSQRDARIAELAADEREDEQNDHSADPALIDRLDQLLHELQLSDDRVATLEDLLRTADEATRAESEERRQLAAWVGDIEAKIGEREAEWQAGQDALQKRIDDLNTERERFNDRLKELGNKEGTAASAKLIEDLREDVESLRRKLATTEEARDALRKKIDDVEFRNSIEARDKYIEEKIREERLELAQEHAKLARERAEVARMNAQAEVKTSPDGHAVDDATCRVQAFREHLKDLHKEESKERDSRKLTSRLARLWKRLET